MAKVDKEVAVAEVNTWLDYKKVNDQKRETYKDNIEALVNAVMDGNLSLKEDKTFVHALKFPIESTDGKPAFETFEYKPRLKMETIHLHLQNVKAGDADGRVCAYVAALTSKSKDIVKKLDTEDYSIAQAIAIFFL